MMKKDFYVIFTENNARILKGKPSNITSNMVVNPDLKKVKGIPPHFWKLENNSIIPMNEVEKNARLIHLNDNSAINIHDSTPHELVLKRPDPIYVYINKEVEKPITKLTKISLFAAGFMLATYLWLIILTK